MKSTRTNQPTPPSPTTAEEIQKTGQGTTKNNRGNCQKDRTTPETTRTNQPTLPSPTAAEEIQTKGQGTTKKNIGSSQQARTIQPGH